jgi:hypothetical protein
VVHNAVGISRTLFFVMWRRSLSNNRITYVADDAFNDLGGFYAYFLTMFVPLKQEDVLSLFFIALTFFMSFYPVLHCIDSDLSNNLLTQVPDVQNVTDLHALYVIAIPLIV